MSKQLFLPLFKKLKCLPLNNKKPKLSTNELINMNTYVNSRDLHMWLDSRIWIDTFGYKNKNKEWKFKI